MNITRHNYEEYFILYMDNELSSDERRMVEIFVQQHPDLKEELDLLLHYKLEPDTSIVFHGKEELLKVNGETPISLSNYEEWLVLYADNELTPAQRKTVEQFAAANPAVKEELDLILRVKLQPEEIVFPYKESLYRNEEKVSVIPIRWLRLRQAFGDRRWRVAAAALIIALGITSVLVINNNKRSSGVLNGGVVKTTPAQDKQSNPVTNNQPTNSTVQVIAEKTPREKINETPLTNIVKQPASPSIKQQDKNIAVQNNKAAVEKTPVTNNPIVPKKEDQVVVENNNKPTNNLPKLINNSNVNNENDKAIATTNFTNQKNNTQEPLTKPEVTNPAIQPSETSNPDISFASLEEGSNNKKSRGLFRKIARTFDKRTNMSAPDDDRLLVAGLSFKLK